MTPRHKKKKKILITGAGGFTGTHLNKLLLTDPLATIYRACLPNSRASFLGLIHCDFLSIDSVRNLVAEIRPDKIYHLMGSYTNRFEDDFASNVITTKNILNAVQAFRMKCRTLLIGSSAEYGFPDSKDTAVTEEHPLRPVSVYGLIKLFQTELMRAYIRLYELDIIAVRPFNLFGKGMSPTLFVGKMEQEIARYKRGEIKEIITGDLSVERDYIEIDEAIKYYRKVMEKGKTGEVYNVGSGKAVPLSETLKGMLYKEGLSMNIVRESTHTVPGKVVVPKIFADMSKTKSL